MFSLCVPESSRISTVAVLVMSVGVSTGLMNIFTACMVSVPLSSWVNLTRKKSFPFPKSVAGVYVQSPVVVIATAAPCLLWFPTSLESASIISNVPVTDSVPNFPVIFGGLVEIYFAVPLTSPLMRFVAAAVPPRYRLIACTVSNPLLSVRFARK